MIVYDQLKLNLTYICESRYEYDVVLLLVCLNL